jgi:hypothetical protein
MEAMMVTDYINHDNNPTVVNGCRYGGEGHKSSTKKVADMGTFCLACMSSVESHF